MLPLKNQIRFRDTKSNLPGNQPSTPPTGTDPTPEFVLLTGHHFIVITEDIVILDHVFGAPSAAGDQPAKSGEALTKLTTTCPPTATDGDSGATMGATKKTFPGIPITISNVSNNNVS